MIHLSFSLNYSIYKTESTQILKFVSGSDFVLMLIIGLYFFYEHYFMIKSDPIEINGVG